MKLLWNIIVFCKRIWFSFESFSFKIESTSSFSHTVTLSQVFECFKLNNVSEIPDCFYIQNLHLFLFLKTESRLKIIWKTIRQTFMEKKNLFSFSSVFTLLHFLLLTHFLLHFLLKNLLIHKICRVNSEKWIEWY